MDAINSLLGGTQQARAAFDAAAGQLAAADLPSAPNVNGANADPTNPVAPAPVGPGSPGAVDVAEQLVTMTVAADLHHVTTAALRSAFSLYQDSLDLFGPAR